MGKIAPATRPLSGSGRKICFQTYACTIAQIKILRKLRPKITNVSPKRLPGLPFAAKS